MLEVLSPPQTSSLSHSRLSKNQGVEYEGPLSDKSSCKTLFFLIATLNEFSSLRSHEFSWEPSLSWVVKAVNCSLFLQGWKVFKALNRQLLNAVDEGLAVCDICSYKPDLDSDPFGEEGSLLSFNYFFYNKHLNESSSSTAAPSVGSTYTPL